MSHRAALVAAFTLSLGGLLSAQTPKPVGPSASPLSHARTAFFVIAEMPRGARERQLRDLQNELTSWNRFKLVDRREDADVTIAFDRDPRTDVETVIVRQRNSGATLWTASERNARSLLTRMKREVPPHAPSFCFAVWCR
jgi:hypothetical protein